MIKLLIYLSFLGDPSYKVRSESTKKLIGEAGVTIFYQEIKWLNSITNDPEIKPRLKEIAKQAWLIENKEKYHANDYYENDENFQRMKLEHFKEDWNR